MTTQQILEELSNDFFLDNEPSVIQEMVDNGVIDEESIKSKWLGYPPASQEAIKQKEEQLGITLPPSYKEFLLCSNGFKTISPFLNNLFSVDQVHWNEYHFKQWERDLHPDYIFDVSDEEYFVYGEEQRAELCRDEYVSYSLKVSEWCDGMCIFLNPIVKHGEEWEVLEYATWYPGTNRYRSFTEYLLRTHQTNQRILNSENNRS